MAGLRLRLGCVNSPLPPSGQREPGKRDSHNLAIAFYLMSVVTCLHNKDYLRDLLCNAVDENSIDNGYDYAQDLCHLGFKICLINTTIRQPTSGNNQARKLILRICIVFCNVLVISE